MIEMPHSPGNGEPKKDTPEPKHRILRKMQDLGVSNDDMWKWDGMRNIVSYEDTFHDLLDQLDYVSFEDLVEQREYELKRPLHVLDLFGGAYFLKDLSSVKTITGARLTNVDEKLMKVAGFDAIIFGKGQDPAKLKKIIDDPKRDIITGDLYKTETWKKLKDSAHEKTQDGFDLIICRPEGPFAVTSKPFNSVSIANVEDATLGREEIYIMLLEKALKLLSPHRGLLFSQIPGLDTPRDIKETFWTKYVQQKEQEGYIFHFDSKAAHPFHAFSVERKQAE
ncbi:MAG: hypothetical protein KBC22_01695 [Candidatus Pacebacteria bacterium]|nr:hypothetical protein [Candidatus Paceibacterota bacterium]